MSFQKSTRVKKARAVVINEKITGESNKRLTLLAKGHGKLTVSAKGAKNQKSKFLSCAQIFCYGDFVLYDGGEFLAVSQMDLIRNFSANYDNIFKLMYGSYFLELADKTVMPHQESDDIMHLLIKSLHKLEKTESEKKISAAFQIKLFAKLGLCPDTICTLCGESDKTLYYSQESFSKGDGFFCGACAKKLTAAGAYKAGKGMLAAMGYLKASDNIFSFKISESVLDELHTAAETLVKSQIEAESKILEIIKRL